MNDVVLYLVKQIERNKMSYEQWRAGLTFKSGMRYAISQIVVTTDSDGNVVLVSRQDEEHRILEIIWEK